MTHWKHLARVMQYKKYFLLIQSLLVTLLTNILYLESN